MPSRDSTPEVLLRRALHRRGVRFRLHRRGLPGRPDLVLVRSRLAVFVDGCFWHACPQHGVLPKSNGEFWREKLEANVARDRRNDRELAELGWRAVRVWEHDDPECVAEELAVLWRAQRK